MILWDKEMAIYQQFEKAFLTNITGVSYIGKPKNFTMMYLTKKIEGKLVLLSDVQGCLVFIENTVNVPDVIINQHIFVACDDPASSYTEIALLLEEKIETEFRTKKYLLTEKGYTIGEDVQVGDNTCVEPLVFIDHGVKIGNNVLIKTGAKIRRNTVIGDDCVIGENTVIGEPAFNITTLENGRMVSIPSFGGVIIGNNVFMGANNSVSKGAADNTIIEDNVKIDSNVRIGHDVRLHNGAEIIACSAIGGYCEIGEHSTTSINCTLKNRTKVGTHCFIGMGSVVHHDIRDNLTVTGSPAITVEQAAKDMITTMKLKRLLKKCSKSEGEKCKMIQNNLKNGGVLPK